MRNRPRHSSARRLPTLPSPTMPTVWPSRSCPMKMLRSIISRRIARSASTMRFDSAQHHRERVLGDRLLVAAGLVEAEHAGLGAGLQVDGVVARAVGRDDQQALRAAQQVRAGVIFLRQLVARRAGLVGMRGGEDRGCDIVRAVVPELVEADVGALLDDLGEYRVGRTVDKEHALAAVGHERESLPEILVTFSPERCSLSRERTPFWFCRGGMMC